MGVLDTIAMGADERKIDTWTLIYEPTSGGRYNGKLLVTSRRLCYDAQFDVSLTGMAWEALFIRTGSAGYLEIPKERIRSVEMTKSLLAKRVVLTLDDGTVHTFNYGMLAIDKVAEAIQQR